MSDLSRLLNPKSIAIIGGGAWCEAVIKRSQEAGFKGPIWSVHPKRDIFAGLKTFAALSDLPHAPDAVFIGVNREITIAAVKELSDMGAGGAICFASGFAESDDGEKLNTELLKAAGAMPLLGPNCYGFLNCLDGAMLWPDIHGGTMVDKGVAIIGQSSNIVLSLTMQKRGLPIAYSVAAGNQAQQGLADIAMACLEDPRVTALGLHVEGFGDIAALERLAARAHILKKPIICLKVGQSSEAQAATLSHTASMAGADAGANALMQRLAIARAHSLDVFLEALKLAHIFGVTLTQKTIASLSCSGGEASLIADLAQHHGLRFPKLSENQKHSLGKHLSNLVTLTNPLDYHTQIWRNRAAMADVFSTMTGEDIGLTILVLDFPRGDRCAIDDWIITLEALEDAKSRSQKPFAMLATIPENLPEDIAQRLTAQNIAPLMGMDAGLEALSLATEFAKMPHTTPILLGEIPSTAITLEEDKAKSALAKFGLKVPQSLTAHDADDAAIKAEMIGFPVVLKGLGLAHKSDHGAVKLNLKTIEDVKAAAHEMPSTKFLVEEMAMDTIAELLIGMTLDKAHGYMLTLGAGGIHTEILKDQQNLLLPASKTDILSALSRLHIWPILNGYRGQPPANMESILESILAIQNYVIAHQNEVVEVEINPLLVSQKQAIAVDALIVRAK